MSVVQGLWVQGPLSPMEELAVRSFLENGHEVHVYSYDPALRVPAGARRLAAEEVLPASQVFCYQAGTAAGSFAAFANPFRYKLLHERGGWWTDLDMICLRPLDPPAPGGAGGEHLFASERLRGGGTTVTTSLLRAPAGSAIFAECYERALHHEDRALTWGATGPALFAAVVERHAAQRWTAPPEAFCPIDWWRAETLLEAGEIPEDSYAVHLWHEKWRSGGWRKDASYSPGVLYQRLHRLYPEPENPPPASGGIGGS